MNEERVWFPSSSKQPLNLEGVLCVPDTAGASPAPALLCHPHPMGGGSMDVGLLIAMESALTAAGIATLRFNFRGVGRSEGVSVDGALETEDVEGAYRFLVSRPEVDASRLMLAGWSFGSWVGFRWALTNGKVERIVLVSPPTALYDFFESLPAGNPPNVPPALIIAGDHDQFAGPAELSRLASLAGAELALLPGVDHFLFGHEREIASLAAAFLQPDD